MQSSSPYNSIGKNGKRENGKEMKKKKKKEQRRHARVFLWVLLSENLAVAPEICRLLFLSLHYSTSSPLSCMPLSACGCQFISALGPIWNLPHGPTQFVLNMCSTIHLHNHIRSLETKLIYNFLFSYILFVLFSDN